MNKQKQPNLQNSQQTKVQQPEGTSHNIDKLKNELKKFKNFSELKVQDFAYEEGYGYELAKDVGEKMKVHQLRKFFSEIKNIDKKVKGEEGDLKNQYKEEIAIILPELAYAKGRNLITANFYEVFKLALSPNLMKTCEDFQRFEANRGNEKQSSSGLDSVES